MKFLRLSAPSFKRSAAICLTSSPLSGSATSLRTHTSRRQRTYFWGLYLLILTTCTHTHNHSPLGITAIAAQPYPLQQPHPSLHGKYKSHFRQSKEFPQPEHYSQPYKKRQLDQQRRRPFSSSISSLAPSPSSRPPFLAPPVSSPIPTPTAPAAEAAAPSTSTRPPPAPLTADPSLPQNQPNVTLRRFPYTPPTGANNSLTIVPNLAALPPGLVEIKVGLLLPYSLPNNITQQLTYSGTSAIRLAVEEINAQQVIPGAYITLVLKDSFNGLDPDNSGAAQAIFSTVSLLQTDGGVSGVIGDVSSALSVQSALLTSRLSIPQCSYSAGSTQLSSKEDYGYFFRTIPTELMFAGVMLDFVISRGWKSVAVFYTGDTLGSEMLDNVVEEAARRNITIGFKRSFWEMGAGSDVGPALDALAASGEQVVLLAAVGTPEIRLMTEAVNKGLVNKNYVWLTINQISESILGVNSSLTPADLNGLFMFDNLLKLDGYPPYEHFLDKWSALAPAEYPYAGQRDISGNEAQAYSCMMVMAHGFADAVRGNWTAMRLLARGRLGSQLKPLNMNTNYIGPGGPMLFDTNGDVVYANFILYNFQHGEKIMIGASYSGEFGLTHPPMYFDGTYTTPANTAPLHVVNPRLGSPVGMVIISVAGLSVLFSLLTMMIVLVYKNAQVIKASSPLFCCLELLGFIFLYTSTVMSLDVPTNAICIARPFTLNVGFVLVVANIVAKNFRIYRIFHNIYVTKRVIRDSHLLKIVGTILAGNLVIMLVWFIKTPPKLQQITLPDFATYWTCDNQHGTSTPFFIVIFIYNAILLLIATFLAYKNRNVAANYNECRQIAFVVYNILLSGCLAMPTIFLPDEQYLTKFVLSTVVILFGTTFSLMFLFLPKLWELFTQIERAQQSRNALNDMNANVGGGESGENSVDGFIYNGVGWIQGGGPGTVAVATAGNIAVATTANSSAGATGIGSGGGVGGGGANGSSINGSGFYLGGRKGSMGTLDESKGETLKETHMGYMGVKLQSRYLSFLARWSMQRVILYPSGRYFTCFELGKPETGRTYSYVNVLIHSREPNRYILQIVGTGRKDILLQVRDEERLMYWYSLFENNKQSTILDMNNANNSSSHLYSIGSSTAALGTLMPLGNLSAPGNIHQIRSESDQTLFADEASIGLQVAGYSPRQQQQQPVYQNQHHLHPLDHSQGSFNEAIVDDNNRSHEPPITRPLSVTPQNTSLQESLSISGN